MKHIAYIHGLNSSPTSFALIAANTSFPEHVAHYAMYSSHESLESSIQSVYAQLPQGEKLTLVGHSLGGVIATIIATDHPELVEKLIVISSPLKGSKAASTLRWLPGSSRVFNDIVPRSPHILKCRSAQLQIPTLSIISTGGHLQTSPEANDGVVSVSSQHGLTFGEKIEIHANHFEVLMHPRTVEVLKDFIFGESND